MAIHGYPGQIISATPPSGFSGVWTLGNLPSPGATVSQIFTFTDTWVCPAGVTSVDYLVVAGGGGGGGWGGGGGGGGFLTGSGLAVTPGTSYTITVGSGGAGGSSAIGTNGGNSTFSTITTNGGGGGGRDAAGAAGGSGGGGGQNGPGGSLPGGAGNTPSTTPSQGSNGGSGGAPSSTAGGGGGGASAVGTAINNNILKRGTKLGGDKTTTNLIKEEGKMYEKKGKAGTFARLEDEINPSQVDFENHINDPKTQRKITDLDAYRKKNYGHLLKTDVDEAIKKQKQSIELNQHLHQPQQEMYFHQLLIYYIYARKVYFLLHHHL
jgi:hypothetical protein